MAYVAMARPDHWFSNGFALPGTALAILLGGEPLTSALWLLVGIPAMCLIASANHVINQWIDRDTDLHHPAKSQRPSVQGHTKRHWVTVEYALLVVLGMALSWAVSPSFFAVSIAFLIQVIL